MAKYSGNIGFAITENKGYGVWEETITVKKYYGDILRNNRRWQQAQQVNDNFEINNQLSILADQFLFNNIGNIRYVEWLGVKWRVSNISINYPRATLDIGGVYNE